jgi:hypothetical protein
LGSGISSGTGELVRMGADEARIAADGDHDHRAGALVE